MSTNIERAAEVIHETLHRWNECSWYHGELGAQALAAEGLLVTDDDKRLIALGKAVERRWRYLPPRTNGDMGWNECLDAIYAEAERGK